MMQQSIYGEQNMRKYLNNFKIDNLTYMQLSKIYQANVTQPQFRNSLYSSIALLALPTLTNLYYSANPSAKFAKAIPLLVPFACIAQFLAVLKSDLAKFCYKDTDDLSTVKTKFKAFIREDYLGQGKKKQNHKSEQTAKKE